MKYINKSLNQNGVVIINDLLEHCWIEEQQCYVNADYEYGLCDNRESFYDDLSQALINEQNSVCCYCLKEINTDDATLEHIIPNKLKIGDFASYLVTNELTNNVIHKGDFDRNTKVIPPERYPHDIAYHNLIASCNSNMHCNHKRGDSPIRPFMYDINVESKIQYDRAGNINCDEYENDLANVGLLRIKSPLNLIRHIWFKLSQKFDTLLQITTETIDEIILDLITNSDETYVIDNFLDEPSYNIVILKYKWFFEYYKSV